MLLLVVAAICITAGLIIVVILTATSQLVKAMAPQQRFKVTGVHRETGKPMIAVFHARDADDASAQANAADMLIESVTEPT